MNKITKAIAILNGVISAIFMIIGDIPRATFHAVIAFGTMILSKLESE